MGLAAGMGIAQFAAGRRAISVCDRRAPAPTKSPATPVGSATPSSVSPATRVFNFA